MQVSKLNKYDNSLDGPTNHVRTDFSDSSAKMSQLNVHVILHQQETPGNVFTFVTLAVIQARIILYKESVRPWQPGTLSHLPSCPHVSTGEVVGFWPGGHMYTTLSRYRNDRPIIRILLLVVGWPQDSPKEKKRKENTVML